MVSLLGGTVSIVEMDGQFLTAGFSPGLLGLAAQAAPSTIAIDNGVEANASAAPSTSVSAPPSNFPPGHNK